MSETYENGHYHVHFYGNNYHNLFSLIGQIFKCSCFFLENGIKVKNCDKYFIFEKTVKFHDIKYIINGKEKVANYPYCDEYYLERGIFYSKKRVNKFHNI